ncbi:hypothetical protein ASD39_06285 [Sphingomonas sp. Root50]|nr:hypothetical protein ASD17_03765 [Sphingomonas sp. Root1294]KQY68278.1 hypothetical protein ASD39_06285 [Sphingomonas sp. Root50]KRB91178.1 hypothetical protein ASE22_13090 [Sphingomonas sp. Root720]
MLYCLSFIDRMILTLLVGPLKADLGLTDTQLGLLHGLAFAMFYATLGYPLGLLADRISRKWLIMTGVLLWVSMTALSAFAQSFWTLFLCRMGLGLGEAALSPAALSLIADYFRPQMRARAASVFITGASVGGALAVMVGGWLAGVVGQGGSVHLPVFGDLRTWQLTLLAVSAPGFVLGLLVMLIREPPRRQSVETQQTSGILAYLRYRRRLLSFHIGGMGLCAVCTYAFSMWIPTLLIRELGWTPIDVAGLYGPALLVASVVGMIGGGMLADRGVRAGDPGRTLKIAFWSMILLMISAILITIVARDTMSMMASLALFNMAGAAPFGVSLAALLATTPNRFRGQITALYLFGLTFGGFAVGPPLAGLFSDHLFPASSGLAHALALLAALSLPLAAVLLGCAIKPYRAAVEDLKLWENLPAEADSGASAAPTSIS